MPFFLPLLLVAQAADSPAANLQPSAQPAIVAAAKACVGVTADPAGQEARVAGWTDVAPADRKNVKTDGRVVMRDNVQIIYRSGSEGGCVVMAKPDAAFDTTTFYADLGTAVGATVVTDGKEPVTKLPNGEVLVTVVALEKDVRLVTLVVGNPNSSYAKKKGK